MPTEPMLDGMLGPRHDFEVLWPVVVALAVAMVHDFVFEQGTSNLTFDDEAMFGDVLSVADVDPDITIAEMAPPLPLRMSFAF